MSTLNHDQALRKALSKSDDKNKGGSTTFLGPCSSSVTGATKRLQESYRAGEILFVVLTAALKTINSPYLRAVFLTKEKQRSHSVRGGTG
tara:strand:+ start:71 stop:340 length:270 start_codon:yes stop_codon:yes gene_type:complete